MNSFQLFFSIILFLVAAWFAWRYYDLKKRVDEYARLARIAPERLPTDLKQIENLSNAVASLKIHFENQLSTLNSENARLSTVLEQLTDGVIIVDANGLIQFANPAAQKLFEISNAPGHSVTEVVRNHQLVDAWRRCQQTNEMQSESVELPARHQFLQLIAIPDTHASGSLLLVQDLTRVRRLETVRRDFISNVSHELRTPLASLKALTETLQSGALSDPEAGPRFLGRISTEVDALTQMAQELLDLSRIESGQVELILAPLAPKSLITSATDRMRMQAERAGLKLSIKCEDGLPNIRADKSRLEQVLVNLIHNAVKFTKPGGDISLETESVTGGVRFAVRDSGVGIPAESLTRIFERFYRVDKSRTGSGTGLGLSISKHIIEAHGGKIWAESNEGRGSVFYFVIPINS
ncbi:ATP-binding protein [Candidatus Villigracilis saccharophilus]|uniref:sensor histidine kinase n=1 Tax=Candidatus Villigracilis saccharophilus TaxID=3140684 RepID=UPI003134CC84|nr:PAS domain-containing protein [Anaerolineales bacterium]